MLLEYALTPEDYLEFNYYTLWKARDKQPVRIKYYVRLVAYTFLFAIVLSWIQNDDRRNEYFLFVIIFFILFVLISRLNLKNLYRKRVNEFLKDERNHHLLEKTRLTINENGLIDTTGKTELKIEWDAIVKSIRNKKYYYLYISSVQAIIIPEDCMSETEKMQLDKLLSEHIPLNTAFNSFKP